MAENSLSLPVITTLQKQDGCVTASARAVIPFLGVNFDKDFLPKLRRYSLDYSNPENNHMLGLAVLAAEMGLSVYVHALNIRTNPSLPTDASEIAKRLHPQLIRKLCALEDKGKLVLSDELLTEDSLYALVKTGLAHGKYALPLLEWKKWNAESQSKFLNPRHVVVVHGLDGLYVLAHDPALNTSQNPVRESIRFLYNSLASQQYIVLIGKGP